MVNVDHMDIIDDDKEWDMSTNIINMNHQQSDPNVDYMVINNINTHNLECGSQEATKVCTATFSYPDKITTMDEITGHIISEINLQNTDKVTLHNIENQQSCSSPFSSNNKDDMVNKRQDGLPVVTNEMDKMVLTS